MSNRALERRERFAFCVYLGMPSVSAGPEQLAVYENETARLYCSATGYPVPQILWSRGDGQSLSSMASVVSGDLVFNSVTAGDEGEYICTAVNRIDRLGGTSCKGCEINTRRASYLVLQGQLSF